MKWAGQGGGCLAWLFCGEGTGLATAPSRVHICSVGALPNLGWAAQLPACGCDETWSLAGRLSV